MWEKYNDEGARQKIETMINKHLWTDNAAAIAEYERGIKLRKQDNDEARDSFREAIRLAPEFLAPKFELGMMAYRKGDNSGAESYLGEIISRIPYYAEAHLVMADISFTKRSYSAAVEHYDRAIEFGFIGKSTLYMIRLRKAQCFYNLDRFTEAVESATDAAKMSPGETEPLIVLSAVYIRQNDLDRAIETLSRANSIQKDNPLVIYQLGSIYYSRDDWRYLSHFDRLFDLTKSENPESYRRIIPILVKGHFEKKNYNRVMEILDSQPSESISYEFTLLRAKSLFHLRQYDACIDQMQKLSLGNEDRLMLASAYAHSGRQPNAKDILQSLVRDGEYKSRAMKDPVLAPIVNEIER
jgi:tetratricopeptide (TPR) repeat protein